MPLHYQPNFRDRFWIEVDALFRTVASVPAAGARPSPAAATPEAALDRSERQHAAALMRVNHAGEVAAQALYRGQALTARSEHLRAGLDAARVEEHDHLSWCAERLAELGSQPSRLSLLWYAGAYSLGALAGLAGDRVSLGFLAETERQVAEHLRDHLRRLPAGDERSRCVLQQMCVEEESHQAYAEQNGGMQLPWPVRQLMRAQAGVMKVGAYRL